MNQGAAEEETEVALREVIISDETVQIPKADPLSLTRLHESLGKKYLAVYLLATLADWLQGPYLYRLYMTHGYDRNAITLLYVTGFASASITGLLIGHLADKFGRKQLCIIYSLTTSLNCLLTSLTNNYFLFLLARILSGASTSILFSAFEAWYVGQHLSRYKIDAGLICIFLAKTTFFNGLLAIFAGFFSFVLVDRFEFGTSAPFVAAIPVSIGSGFLCAILWDESPSKLENSNLTGNLMNSLNILLFSSKKNVLIFLGLSQSLFETVMYIFVLLWTPILEPLNASQGLIFGTFMVAIMIGSIFAATVSKTRVKTGSLLFLAIFLGTFAIFGSCVAVYFQQISFQGNEKLASFFCWLSFVFFEISVGIYYPSSGYVRGIIIPESHRAGIANWLRLPSNCLICLSLLYIAIETPSHVFILSICCLFLIIASLTSFKFSQIFGSEFQGTMAGKQTTALSSLLDYYGL